MDTQTILIYYNVLNLGLIIFIILYWYIFFHRRGNVYFLRKVQGVYFQVAHERIKPSVSEVRFEEKTYRINSAFFDGNKPNAFFDIDSGNMLRFKEIEVGITPKLLDLFLGERIIEQIARQLKEHQKELLLGIVIGAIVGVMVGLFIAPYLPAPTIAKMVIRLVKTY
jgi:hypothetical protein